MNMGRHETCQTNGQLYIAGSCLQPQYLMFHEDPLAKFTLSINNKSLALGNKNEAYNSSVVTKRQASILTLNLLQLLSASIKFGFLHT